MEIGLTQRKAPLGELESFVLLAVLRLADGATAKGIRDEIATRGGREITRGAMYATLSRLERKGFLAVTTGDESSGGRGKHHFSLTAPHFRSRKEPVRPLRL